jgi:hypothetical protein
MATGVLLSDRMLQIGLVGFTADEERELRVMLARMYSPQMPWVAADALPYHALLLARGSRAGDPEHMAVLRVSLPQPNDGERRLEPLMLRKPIREAALKLALEAAAARLRAVKS